jgi:hypothetical protein
MLSFSNHNQRLALITLTFLLSACLGMSGYNFETIYGVYNIGWIDEKSNQRICKSLKAGEHGGETLIKPYVFAVGHNTRFIIAKQHPINNGVLETGITNYYIIDMSLDPYAGQKGIYGPLSHSSFDSMRQDMKIIDIQFDRASSSNQ